MKLGKLAPKHDSRTLKLSSIFSPALGRPPAIDFDWTAALPSPAIGMMLNDQIGLCTCAGFAHLVQVMTAAHLGKEITIYVRKAKRVQRGTGDVLTVRNTGASSRLREELEARQAPPAIEEDELTEGDGDAQAH